MTDPSALLAVAATFLLAGTVKGVVGFGLPTVSLALLTIAFVDDFIHVLRGNGPVYETAVEGVLETRD